jgi:hypothetical protein
MSQLDRRLRCRASQRHVVALAILFAVPLGFAIALSSFAPSAQAEVFRCTNAAGKVEFTDRPCVTGESKKVTVQPNAVGPPVNTSAIKAKTAELDKQIKARQASEDAANAQAAEAFGRRYEECVGYRDAYDRQLAWLSSLSMAVRQSASNEMAIQKRRMVERDCRRFLN